MSEDNHSAETVAAEPEEPWKDKATLEGHIENEDSYRDMADEYEVSVFTIQYWVQKHGLEAAGKIEGPRWKGSKVPLLTYEPYNVAFPIPVEYLKQMDPDYEESDGEEAAESGDDDEVRPGRDPIMDSVPEAPDRLRFTPRLKRDGIYFDVEWGQHVNGELSNERAVLRPGTLHAYAQFPRSLAASFKLHQLGEPAEQVETGGGGGVVDAALSVSDDSTDTEAEVDFDGTVVEIAEMDEENNRLRIELSPSAGYYAFDAEPGDDRPAQGALEPETKPLFELVTDNEVQSYRLDPSLGYVEVYNLEAGDDYFTSISPVWVDGEQYLALVIHFEKNEAEQDDVHESLERIITSYQAGDYSKSAPEGEKRRGDFTQLALYPGKQLLHAVGLPDVTEEPLTSGEGELSDAVKRTSQVRVVPAKDAIVLIPPSDES